ncbi:hypothetical protein EGW08_021797 [Elysia chlorotica]|uniref:Uncharacterized protein n=1 Tax=Elysia chlorotica TaxID=188477 RepID=A0A433SMM4_ELYCH|nr:hypothetical protein EGW08_021797 [Elysia chlorotica]
MDNLPCPAWMLPGLVASWLVLLCHAQTVRLFSDSRLVYPGTSRRGGLGRPQQWSSVYQRSGHQLNGFNPQYLGGRLNTLSTDQLHRPASVAVNRAYMQQPLYPDTRTFQTQRDSLSYLIPKVASNPGVYIEPSIVTVPGHGSARFEGPSYIKVPLVATGNVQRVRKPSYLDPRNFKAPDMTLEQMEAALGDIQKHIRAKEMGNPDEYTGSRVLILLLREQCARLALADDPDILQFCSTFDARFRTKTLYSASYYMPGRTGSGQLKTSSDQVTTSSNQLKKSSDQLQTSSDQLKTSSDQLKMSS